jgi:hypothetical protein
MEIFWWYPRGNDNENSILGEAKPMKKENLP